MPHHSLADKPLLSMEQIDASIRRAHQLRSQSYSSFFKKALDRRYRALETSKF